MTEVAVRSSLSEDLYIVLTGWNDQGRASFHVFVNPFVQFIWIGIAIITLGGVFVLFPDKKARRAKKVRPREDVQYEAA